MLGGWYLAYNSYVLIKYVVLLNSIHIPDPNSQRTRNSLLPYPCKEPDSNQQAISYKTLRH